MDSIFNLEKGKLFTVVGVESVTVSTKTGIDFMCDTESKNVLVADEDRFDLDSPAGEVVRAFLDNSRDLTTDELQVAAEVDLRSDGELVLVGVEDISNVTDDGWDAEDDEAYDFDEDGEAYEDDED